ncbi:hypothetical protein BDW69DRAFT_118923 [Aspergillus filifer]
MATPYTKTIDGNERQLAVNHLAHFTLTMLLLPTLIHSSSENFKSRIIQVSSSSHRYATVDLNDVHYIYGESGFHALSVHPSGTWSGLSQYLDQGQVEKWKKDEEMGNEMKSPAQGAATTVWAAIAPALEGKGGIYLAECKVSTRTTMDRSVFGSGRWV